MTQLAEADDASAGPASSLRAFMAAVTESRVTLVAMVVIVAFIVLAVIGPWVAPWDPTEQSFLDAGQGASVEHWFGTDRYGRDIFSRVLVGTRYSLLLGLAAPAIAGLFGTVLGMLAGFFGGWVDRVTGRITDMLLAFPALLLGILLGASLGPGFGNLIAAVALAFLPRFIRVARAATLSVRREPYVEASFAAGQTPLRVIIRHVLPNISGSLTVVATLWVATAIRIEATLSFIGLGVQPPEPSWGNIIRDGLTNLLGSPAPVIAAGGALTLCVLSFNIVGDAVRDALDPEYRE